MTLRQDLNSNKFIFTAELNPPKAADISILLERAHPLKNLVSAINITDNSGASMKMASLAVSYLMQRETGIEAIWQMTCRDRNRLGLQSDLLGGWALGLRNILILSGDPADKGDAPTTKGSFDLKSDELLLAVAKLKQGKDYDDNPLAQGIASSPTAPRNDGGVVAGNDGAPHNDRHCETRSVEAIPVPSIVDYCAAAAAHPGVPDLKAQAETMQRRYDIGAEFFQTQIVFDIDQLKRFADSIPEELAKKTLIGITPLKTLGQANFINKNIWGVNIPQTDIAAMTAAIGIDDAKSADAMKRQHQAGLKIAKTIVDEVRKLPFKGVHVMAIAQEDRLAEIISSL